MREQRPTIAHADTFPLALADDAPLTGDALDALAELLIYAHEVRREAAEDAEANAGSAKPKGKRRTN